MRKGIPRYVPTARTSRSNCSRRLRSATCGSCTRIFWEDARRTGHCGRLRHGPNRSRCSIRFCPIGRPRCPTPISRGTLRRSRPAESSRSRRPTRPTPCISAPSSSPCATTIPTLPPLALGDFILGDSTLSSRLGDRVRQQEGFRTELFQPGRVGRGSAHLDVGLRHLQSGQHRESRKAIAEEIDPPSG